jgi:broad specificity phosphatase PhoE
MQIAPRDRAILSCMTSQSFLGFLTVYILGVFFSIVYRIIIMDAGLQSATWKYAAQKGFFSHDEDPESWDFRATTRAYLGLLERAYPTDAAFDPKRERTQWQRFEHYVYELNKQGPTEKKYRMLYVIRHGQGIHNVKEKEVGREEWDRYWSKLPGDGVTTWEDAALTDFGEQQARDMFSTAISDIPHPEAIYTSPLRRCLRTTELAFAHLLDTRTPTIKENLRERLGVHTCDKRSSKTFIKSAYPSFNIEPGFTEDDKLWKPDVRETFEEHVVRTKSLLDEVFNQNKESLFVSLTMHSGAIMALFGATGWNKVPVAAGAVYPLLILAERES